MIFILIQNDSVFWMGVNILRGSSNLEGASRSTRIIQNEKRDLTAGCSLPLKTGFSHLLRTNWASFFLFSKASFHLGYINRHI